jgi:hypothetical protein
MDNIMFAFCSLDTKVFLWYVFSLTSESATTTYCVIKSGQYYYWYTLSGMRIASYPHKRLST